MAAPTFLLTYTLSTRTITLHAPDVRPEEIALRHGETFWDWFADGQRDLTSSLNARDGSGGGWRGGWVGWFGYEMKEESLQGYKRGATGKEERIDACWAWADRLLERTNDGEWVARGIVTDGVPERRSTESDRGDTTEGLVSWLNRLGISIGVSVFDFDTYAQTCRDVLLHRSSKPTSPCAAFPIFHPASTSSTYRDRIDACREAIRQGESYELTLTTSFSSPFPPSTDPFALYVRLRTFNPAYYSAYMSFPCLGIHVLSSSPERFLKIDGQGQVEMMPIQGTRARVKPGECVCENGQGCRGAAPGSEACRAQAIIEDARRGAELQADTKERAENLMVGFGTSSNYLDSR